MIANLTTNKGAELASTIGVGVLGLGLGAAFSAWIASYSAVLLLAGALLHGTGMLLKHRIERRSGDRIAGWMVALYWLCWLFLFGLLIYIVSERLQG